MLRRPDISADRSNATTNSPTLGSPASRTGTAIRRYCVTDVVTVRGTDGASAADLGQHGDELGIVLEPHRPRLRGRAASCSSPSSSVTTPSFLPGTRLRMPSLEHVAHAA